MLGSAGLCSWRTTLQPCATKTLQHKSSTAAQVHPFGYEDSFGNSNKLLFPSLPLSQRYRKEDIDPAT